MAQPQARIAKEPLVIEYNPEDIQASATEYVSDLMEKVNETITTE